MREAGATMRFKVKRTQLDDPTARPYADTRAGPNPTQRVGGGEWDVEIATLEALMVFIRKHGEVVIGTDGTDVYLEIYDAYRESDPEGPERR